MRKRLNWERFGPLLPISVFVAFAAAVVGVGYVFYRFAMSAWYLAFLGGALIAVAQAAGRRVRPTVWSMVTNGLALLTMIWIFSWLDARWWWKALLLLVVATPVLTTANRAQKAAVWRAAHRRATRATALLHDLLESASTARFALYLRPFATTDRLSAQTIRPELGSSFDNRVSHVDVEAVLGTALRKDCTLVGLGRPEDIAEGAARITTTEAEWRAAVQKLADAAELIVVVPLAREGTLWEVAELRQRRLLGRTAFLMPEIQRVQPSGVAVPTQEDRTWDAGISVYEPSAHQIDLFAEWTSARPAYAGIGVHLPAYCGTGALFTVDPDSGQLTRAVPLPLSVLHRRSAYVRTALAHLGLLAGRPPVDNIVEAVEVAAYPNIRSREFTLMLAFDLFVAVGDRAAVAHATRRLNRVVRGRPRLLNGALAQMPQDLADLPDHLEREPLARHVRAWLAAARDIDGRDPELFGRATRAVDSTFGPGPAERR